VAVRRPVPVVRCTRVLVNGVYVKRCVWRVGGQPGAVWLWFATDGLGHAQNGCPKPCCGALRLPV